MSYLFVVFEVNGIGPTFKMVVDIQNTSLSQPSMDLMVTFQYDEKLYKVAKSVIHVSRYFTTYFWCHLFVELFLHQ